VKIKKKIKRESEYYAFEYLKTLKDADGYISYRKGDIKYVVSDVDKKMMDELVQTGRTGFHSGHSYMTLTSKEVRIRKYKVSTLILTKEVKCNKKVKKSK
jgi:hypothetical protein